MINKSVAILLILGMFAFVGCAGHTHTVGEGARTGMKEEARQWYAAWGLVPLNNIDTKAMSGGSKDYTVKTEHSGLDVIISFVTSAITIVSRTVTVTR